MKDKDRAAGEVQPQGEAAKPKASAIEQLANVYREDRARVLTILGDVFPLMDIVEPGTPGGQQKLQRLLDDDDDWRSVMVVFRYKA